MLKVDHLEETLERLRLGCPVILLDDRKEAEGDLFCPASVVTPEVLQFMVRRASGLLCMSLPRTRLEEIGIPRLTEGVEILASLKPNFAKRFPVWRRFLDSIVPRLADTPFHFPVDLAWHHSGISVVERLETIQALMKPDATIDWFTVPGHLPTLGAHPRGLVGRWGHTEASVDLCRALGLEPAGLLCEIVGDDGFMLRGEELAAFAEKTRVELLPLSALVDALTLRPAPNPV